MELTWDELRARIKDELGDTKVTEAKFDERMWELVVIGANNKEVRIKANRLPGFTNQMTSYFRRACLVIATRQPDGTWKRD